MTDNQTIEYIYTVNFIGTGAAFFGKSVWGAYTNETSAIMAAKKDRQTFDAYVEKIAVGRFAPSITVWKSWDEVDDK
jgi:hypothetical protein